MARAGLRCEPRSPAQLSMVALSGCILVRRSTLTSCEPGGCCSANCSSFSGSLTVSLVMASVMSYSSWGRLISMIVGKLNVVEILERRYVGVRDDLPLLVVEDLVIGYQVAAIEDHLALQVIFPVRHPCGSRRRHSRAASPLAWSSRRSTTVSVLFSSTAISLFGIDGVQQQRLVDGLRPQIFQRVAPGFTTSLWPT